MSGPDAEAHDRGRQRSRCHMEREFESLERIRIRELENLKIKELESRGRVKTLRDKLGEILDADGFWHMLGECL